MYNHHLIVVMSLNRNIRDEARGTNWKQEKQILCLKTPSAIHKFDDLGVDGDDIKMDLTEIQCQLDPSGSGQNPVADFGKTVLYIHVL
jgi:hypothetical protein